jgi:hypothetical protein
MAIRARYNPGVDRIPARALDTSVEADRVQIELLRSAAPGRRLQLACSLSASVITLARAAIARANPGADPIEHDVRFVELHYGRTLALAVRSELERRVITKPANGDDI